MVQKWLSHPLTCGLEIDDPKTTQLRYQIIQQKGFLKKIYQKWYALIASAIPAGDGALLELGSGAGFIKEVLPDFMTSEIFKCPDIDMVLDGTHLPFVKGALKGIVMTDVFHHISEPRSFLVESARCVRPGGALIMIEPWVSAWSKQIYGRWHHEPFDPGAESWEFPSSGPLSGANGALPWIVFQRDLKKFEMEFPQWQINMINPFMPFLYLLSGGISMRSLMPGWSFGAWQFFENCFQPWMDSWAMFSFIVLNRNHYMAEELKCSF